MSNSGAEFDVPASPCPACRNPSLSRKWTGVTEVDTFDTDLGGWTEYHFRDGCSECAWQSEGITRTAPDHWRAMQTGEERLWFSGRPDFFLEGSAFLELDARADIAATWEPRPARNDVCKLVCGYLERNAFQKVPIRFATEKGTFELSLRPDHLAQTATSLSLQLADGAFGRAMLGEDGDWHVEIERHGEHAVARLVSGTTIQAVMPGPTWLGAIDAMWNGAARPGMLALAGNVDSRLGETLGAVTAGLGATLAPREAIAIDPVDALRELAPDVASEIEAAAAGVDGDTVWAGAAPNTTLSFSARVAEWNLRVNDAPSSFYLCVRPGRIVMESRIEGRSVYFEERFAAGYSLGVGERLAFAWRNRTAFLDGLWLVDGILGASESLIVSPREPLTLEAVGGGVEPIVIAPAPEVSIGRSPSADISIDHRLVSKRQAVVSSRGDGWHIADAASTSGTYLGGELLRDISRPLRMGDELRIGGLVVIVLGEPWKPARGGS